VKKIVYIAIVIILLVVINNLSHSIYDLWHKQDLLTAAQKQLDLEKTKNKKLKAELSYVQSQAFIEEQARDKLFMSKPGEHDVLIPKNLLRSEKAAPKPDLRPNWQKWVDLFIK
jgi:cell division protein FtsB